jgi:hypothetical protein
MIDEIVANIEEFISEVETSLIELAEFDVEENQTPVMITELDSSV